MTVVGGVHLQHQRGLARRCASLVVARWVRLVVPTSRSARPRCAMMSGMRKEPPISISSPRETIDLAPAGQRCSAPAARRRRCCSPTVAASAPVSSRSRPSTWSSRSPRPPVAGRTPGRPAPRIACGDGRDRLLRQERAAEIGVQHRAGEVEHRPQARRDAGRQGRVQRGADGGVGRRGVRQLAGQCGAAQNLEVRAQGRRGQRAAMTGQQRLQGRQVQRGSTDGRSVVLACGVGAGDESRARILPSGLPEQGVVAAAVEARVGEEQVEREAREVVRDRLDAPRPSPGTGFCGRSCSCRSIRRGRHPNRLRSTGTTRPFVRRALAAGHADHVPFRRTRAQCR